MPELLALLFNAVFKKIRYVKKEKRKAAFCFKSTLIAFLPPSCVSVTYFKLIITGRVFIERTDIIIQGLSSVFVLFFNNKEKKKPSFFRRLDVN